MFLRFNLGNIVIVEKKRRMCRFFDAEYSDEHNFLSLLAMIWIESHFPLKGPITDFFQVNNRCVYIMYN